MIYKSNLLTLVAAGLLALLLTACTDDLNGTDGTQGEGYGVPVQGISFFEAEPFAEDTLAGHQPTMTTNVADAPDMDVMGRVTYDSRTEAKARRAAKANGGVPRGSLEELVNGPNLARDLKKREVARVKMSRAAGDTLQKDRIVAGRKLAVPVRHKATDADSIQTRSFDTDDVSAIFVMGDSVGVYELDASGNIVNSNVKFVYNAGLWHSDVVLNYQAGHRYFAYHPYRTNEQLTELGMTVDPTKIDYEGFFSNFAEKWPVSDDQGTYEKYHACDLLAGEATWNAETATLGFPMHHLMGMLQLEFGIARIYLDWADEREDHYPYWWTDTVTSHLKEMILLPKFGGKYRRITRPGTELTVAAIDDAWTLHFEAASSISRGHYQHYDIGKTRSNNTEFYQMFYNQLGDILLQDGRLMHRHDWNRIHQNTPVGIVVGTVYPAVDPFSETIVGPLETNADGTLYNCHSLEREYLYNMEVLSTTGTEPDTVTVVMRPLFIRCLVMSLKDVSYSYSGSDIYFAGSWGAAWSWNEALSHMPVTHCVGVAANNIWSSEELASRVNNSWYPNMSSSWNAVTACENFNNGLDTHVYTGDGGIKQKTPNSGWFIGTCGQYQMAFCFGRERAFGDSWKKAHPREGHPEDLDNDGAVPVWDFLGGTNWYNNQYNVTQRIGYPTPQDGGGEGYGNMQNRSRYRDYDYYEKSVNGRKRVSMTWWYPYGSEEDDYPTAYHDFIRIDNAMQYALGPGSLNNLYQKLSGEYATSTLRCDISLNDRFFPEANKDWNYDYKYWNYHNWKYVVTVNVNRSYISERGKCYYLSHLETYRSGKIRPLMAL